jgi:hypothetical protein
MEATVSRDPAEIPCGQRTDTGRARLARREKKPFPACRTCALNAECMALSPQPTLLWQWQKLGLLDRALQLTPRGEVVSFLLGPEGLALAAASEFAGRGDIDRLLTEWRSLLRLVVHAPLLELPDPPAPATVLAVRWNDFRALGRAQLGLVRTDTLPDLPPLTPDAGTAAAGEPPLLSRASVPWTPVGFGRVEPRSARRGFRFPEENSLIFRWARVLRKALSPAEADPAGIRYPMAFEPDFFGITFPLLRDGPVDRACPVRVAPPAKRAEWRGELRMEKRRQVTSNIEV